MTRTKVISLAGRGKLLKIKFRVDLAQNCYFDIVHGGSVAIITLNASQGLGASGEFMESSSKEVLIN